VVEGGGRCKVVETLHDHSCAASAHACIYDGVCRLLHLKVSIIHQHLLTNAKARDGGCCCCCQLLLLHANPGKGVCAGCIRGRRIVGAVRVCMRTL